MALPPNEFVDWAARSQVYLRGVPGEGRDLVQIPFIGTFKADDDEGIERAIFAKWEVDADEAAALAKQVRNIVSYWRRKARRDAGAGGSVAAVKNLRDEYHIG